MPKDNEVKNLIINKLTKEQFKTVSDSSTNYEVYHITDDAHYTEAEIQKLLNTKQDVLIAGAGLEIKDGVISNTHSNPKWGDLQGDVFEQLDLKNALYANNIYESNGLVLIDEQGFNDVQEYKHSTFDLSKFEVVGSPRITSDGVASGFNSSNYLKTIPLTDLKGKSWTIRTKWINQGITTPNYSNTFFTFGSWIAWGSINYAYSTRILKFYIKTGTSEEPSIEALGQSITLPYDPSYIYASLSFDIDTGVYTCKADYGEGEVLVGTYTATTTNKELYIINTATTQSITIGSGSDNTYNKNATDLKQFSITVDGKEVFNANKNGLDVIKQDNYTVVGTPTISEDGVASITPSRDALHFYNLSEVASTHDWDLYLPFTVTQNLINRTNNTWIYRVDNICLGQWYTNNSFNIYLREIVEENNEVISLNLGVYNAKVNDKVIIHIKHSVSTKTIFAELIVNGSSANSLSKNYTGALSWEDNEIVTSNLSSWYLPEGNIEYDLNSFKIYVDGNLVYQPCLKIPYNVSKTGSKIVDAVYRDRVKDVYEQFGQAEYYTIDEENKNFTLPMGEIYGMITTSNDRISVLEDEQPIQNMFSTGEISKNKKGYSQLEDMYHSTFDLSKFTVIGSPNITEYGVASGFSSSDYLKLPLLDKDGQIEKLRIGFNLLGTNYTASTMIARLHETSLMIYMNGTGRVNVAQPANFGTQYFLNSQPQNRYADCFVEVILDKNSKQLTASYYENETLIETRTVSSTMPSLLNISSWADGATNSNGYWHLGYQGFNGGFLGSIDLKQFSITVDGKEVFNANKTGIDVIKPDDYTVVGSPTISDDGVASGFSRSNYIAKVFSDIKTKNLKIKGKAKYQDATNEQIPFLLKGAEGYIRYFRFGINPNKTLNTRCILNDGTDILIGRINNVPIENGDFFEWEWIIGQNKQILNYKINDTTYSEEFNTDLSATDFSITSLNLGTYGANVDLEWKNNLDLNAFKIYVDGNLVYQPCLKIPYTISKTGSKIVDVAYRDRVEDVYNQYGQADYYTIDKENENFTLPMGEIYGIIEDKQYQLDDKVSLTKDEIITGQKTFEKDIITNGTNVDIKPNSGDGSIRFSDGERIRFAQGGQTVISANNTSIYLRTKSNRDGTNQVELKTDGTLSATKFKGPLDGIATQATKDSSGLQINTTYMRKTIGTQGIPQTPTAPTYLEMVGRQGCGNGNIAGGNLVALHKNTLYKCNERGSTITCNYDDKVANLGKSMCDGSFSGHYPAINPSTSFTSKPFTWEVTSSAQYEVSDVCRLHIYSHRLTDPINVTKFKIEAYIHDTLTNSKKWITAYEYSGSSINIAQTGYGLYISGYSSNSYYSIYGIRLTISESPDTVFRLSEIQLVASRGTETIADSLHCVSDAGGKIWGNLEVTGTVNGKCTKDGNGNVIVDTYATKTEVGGKQDTLTAGTGINISNNTISATFTDTKVQSNVSNANSNVPILLNNGTSATTNVALINSLINANPSTGTINAQHGKFGKSLTTYRYVASETPNTTFYWYKIYSSSTSDQIVNFEISAHGDANYPYFSKYTISISNYRATTTSVVVHNHGTTKNSDIKVAIDAQGNVYLQTNCIWSCNLNVNNTYGTATITYENMGYSSFGVPVGFTSLGMLTNCGAMRLTKSTGEVQYSDVTTSSIADGIKAKSGQILYDWVGTKEEYETGIVDGTISEDWICWVTDEESGDKYRSMPIGSVFSITASNSYVPDGCLPCNGTEYSKSQFVELYTNYLGNGLINTCTYSDYEAEIATYGQCSKFAVDKINEKFRVPLIKDTETVVTNNIDYANGVKLSTTLPLEATPYVAPADGLYYVEVYKNNAQSYLYINGVESNYYYDRSDSVLQTPVYAFVKKGDVIYWSATLSVNYSKFYPYKEETKEKLKSFVVVANGQTNQSLMDWSAWASSLQSKLNADHSNDTKPYIVEVSDKSILPSWYKVYSNGWCEQGGQYSVTSASPHTINLLKSMVNTQYSILISAGASGAGDATVQVHIRTDNITTTSFKIQKQWSSNSGTYFWQANGYIN